MTSTIFGHARKSLPYSPVLQNHSIPKNSAIIRCRFQEIILTPRVGAGRAGSAFVNRERNKRSQNKGQINPRHTTSCQASNQNTKPFTVLQFYAFLQSRITTALSTVCKQNSGQFHKGFLTESSDNRSLNCLQANIPDKASSLLEKSQTAPADYLPIAALNVGRKANKICRIAHFSSPQEF
jgi:hypothetical protein